MKLNCDLGESYGHWQLGQDQQVMPLIDMANIACGFHAGDAMVMRHTVVAAKQHSVEIGAHPSYPDIQGFGRRSMRIPADELIALLHYQIAALEGVAKTHGADVSYVKPHGALYNDMMGQEAVMHAVMQGIATYYRPLPLLIQATAQADHHKELACEAGISLRFEAFADRRYQDDGTLMPRKHEGAVLDKAATLEQARLLLLEGCVETATGNQLTIDADTLCVHGDNAQALDVVKAIRAMLKPS